MLILPPPNHSAWGGSHFKTVSHFLNQCSSSAMRAQNASGSAAASARSRASSSIDLMCACSENECGGRKILSSCNTDSMFVVTLDMGACVPYFIATKKDKSTILTMTLYVGTSGYSYKEWKGSFYPDTISPKDMLRFYGERFRSVESNNQVYRMPNA